MPNLIKYVRNILLLLIIITLIIQFFPIISVGITNKVCLTNEQLSNGLTTLDIFLSTVLAVYSLVEQRSIEERCVYDFSILENSLNLHKYIRFPSETSNSFMYTCDRENDGIDTPYYGMEIALEDKALCSVGIPLCMKISTKLNGKSIVLSDLKISIMKQGKIEKTRKESKGVAIEKPIQDEKEFLIRILLLCNHQLEKILLDSCIYLSFVLTLIDDRGRKYNKYLFLKVQNTMGESRILSISSKNNWFSYIGKLINQHYLLNRKNY